MNTLSYALYDNMDDPAVMNLENIRRHIEAGASPNTSVNEHGETIVQTLCVSILGPEATIPVFEYLLSLPNINITHVSLRGKKLIHYAVEARSSDLFLRILLRKSVENINTPIEPSRYRTHRDTPLNLACTKLLPDRAQILLDNGADPNLWSAQYGYYPLHSIISDRCSRRVDRVSALISMLVKSGARINAKDKHGDTVLHTAICERNMASVCWLLMELGADAQLKNNAGKTAVDLASGRELAAIKRWLDMDKFDMFNLITGSPGTTSEFYGMPLDIVRELRSYI